LVEFYASKESEFDVIAIVDEKTNASATMTFLLVSV
jgi:hypothetical protein